MSPMCSPGNEQPGGADQRQPRHPLRVADGVFGGEPAADAMADQREAVELQRVEQLVIVKQEILDAVALQEIAGAVAAGVRRRDQPVLLRQPLVERLQVAGDAMDVGKAVQIDQRRA